MSAGDADVERPNGERQECQPDASQAARDGHSLQERLGIHSDSLETILNLLHGSSLGLTSFPSLLLMSEDRVRLLSHLKARGVDSLPIRQKCANSLSKVRRGCELPPVVPADVQPIFHASQLAACCNRHQGTVGMLLAADGSCHHVNEEARFDQYGSCNLSPVAGYCKLDGPIVAELVCTHI